MTKNKKPEKDGIHRILLAAVDEFCRAGLAGAKLDVIALEAGVSKQLIHHYYRTKAELYVAVIDHITTQAIARLEKIDYEKQSPDAALRLFLAQVFDFFVHWPFLAGLYNDQGLYGGEHMPECRELIARSPALMARLEAVFLQGQQQGLFDARLGAQESIAAALMVVIGCFTNSPILSSLISTDFVSQEAIGGWKSFSIDFALAAIKTRAD